MSRRISSFATTISASGNSRRIAAMPVKWSVCPWLIRIVVSGNPIDLISAASFSASWGLRCTSITTSDLPFEKMYEFTVANLPL